MKTLRTAAAVVLVILVLWPSLGYLTNSDGADAPVTWTIMLYMAGDALPELPWLDNINSMEAASQALGTTIVALVDPLGDGNSRLLRIMEDPNGLDAAMVSTVIDDNGAVIPASGEVDMADPANLTRFLAFSELHYPSSRKVLVLWGHGAGWAGLCPDETGGNDILTLPELSKALNDTGFGYSLDIVAVDACVAATFEMLYQVMDHVRYFVAAENNVPYQGLPYTAILNDLAADTGMPVSAFGAKISSEYINAAATVSPYSATMGVFNLSKMQDLGSALSSLSTVSLTFDDIFHSTINEVVSTAESYYNPYYFDFGDFLRRLQRENLPIEMKVKAIEAMTMYGEVVVAFDKYNHPDPVDGIRVTNATGIALYAPSTSFTDLLYGDLALAQTEWYDFGKAARLVRPNLERERGPTPTYLDSPTDNDTLADSVQLTWPAIYEEYWIWVYGRQPGGYVLLGLAVTDSQEFTLSSWFGDLMLTTYSTNSSSAKTYDVLNITLYGTVVVTVHLTQDGKPATKPYEVRVAMKNMTWYYQTDAGVATLNLSVPTQIGIGDMLDLEVVSPGSDSVFGSARVTVPDRDLALEISVYSQSRGSSGTFALLVFSILPGALVLVFALMLFVEGRRKKA